MLQGLPRSSLGLGRRLGQLSRVRAMSEKTKNSMLPEHDLLLDLGLLGQTCPAGPFTDGQPLAGCSFVA